MNPKAVGEMSEAKILVAVMEKGFIPSIPFGNNQRYDLLLDDGQTVLRAQCKTGWLDAGAITFAVSSKNGFTGKRTHYKGQVDVFLVYSPDLNKVYKVPVSLAPESQMRLRVDQPKLRGNKSTVHWAKDFEF